MKENNENRKKKEDRTKKTRRKTKVSLRGALQGYLVLPVIFTLMLLLTTFGCLWIGSREATVFLYLTTFTFVIFMVSYFLIKRHKVVVAILHGMEEYSSMQKLQLKELAVPFAILDYQGRMTWGNNAFIDLLENKKSARRGITNVFPELTMERFPAGMQDVETEFVAGERYYKAIIRLLYAEGLPVEQADENVEAVSLGEDAYYGLYLYDETEIYECRQRMEDEHIVMGLLYLDNYEEVLGSVDSISRSLVAGLVERKIRQYLKKIDAIVKKQEKDRYFFVFRKKYLSGLKEDKFSIMEEVRNIRMGNEMSMTISVGIGLGSDSYHIIHENTRSALDLALGRGGDQVVVKENDKLSYYGGKTVQTEKATRVKARVKAHALRELLMNWDQVAIMGHKDSDIDCIGSAIGLYRLAKSMGKEAYIVVDKTNEQVCSYIERFRENSDYGSAAFMDNAAAKALITSRTLLILVDVNKPAHTQCPELLEQVKSVVILDHHRQGGEKIENAVLSYIEPAASSSCEMVAEILQYAGVGIKLKSLEAECMYAGIMIDTNNFTTKTGSRTFEAAAYLRKNGADINRIRKNLRTNFSEYQIRAEAMGRVQIFMGCYAITECRPKDSKNPTVLGAQVANELLNISEVKASFVLTEHNQTIYISARSMDEVNVQRVMEEMGGGGHLGVAGTQLENVSMELAWQKLRDTLTHMTEQEDI